MSWMTWGHASYLWFLALIPVGIFLEGFWRHRRKIRMTRWADPDLWSSQTVAPSKDWEVTRTFLFWTGLALCFLALAAPRFGVARQKLRVKGLDVVVVLDCSRSMLADDLTPNRREAAIGALRGLLRDTSGYRWGLVGFSRHAIVLCPLTTDTGAIEIFLKVADPDLFPAPGTHVGEALSTAKQLFPTPSRPRVILLISDGEDLESKAMTALQGEPIPILSWGCGLPQGAPVPAPNGKGPLQDGEGHPIISRPDFDLLTTLSKKSSGRFWPLRKGAVQGANATLRGMARGESQINGGVIPAERYAWPLVPAFLCWLGVLAIPRRRDWP